MHPRIQYARTADGASIAYSVLGEGHPLVTVALPNTHIENEWNVPEIREERERTARLFRHVRYDPRGFGMSERGVRDLSLDALVGDLETIVDHLSLEMFHLVAQDIAVPVAIAYAARHPERLSHLVLAQGSARGADLSNEQIDGLLALGKKDWELASESIEQAFAGWSEPDAAHQGAAMLREAVTPGTLISLIRQARGWDVSALLPQVTVPTLVIHPRNRRGLNVEMARQLAVRIPDARLVLVEGPYIWRPEGLAAIRSFLLGREVVPGTSGSPPGTAVIGAGATPLTARETEILRLIAAGLTSKEISRDLSLSVRTVGRHITNVYNKIGARSRADATAYALRRRLTRD